MSEGRDRVLEIIRTATGGRHPLRWVDSMTTRGDFDGRPNALDVFDVSVSDEAVFLASVRPRRTEIRALLGAPCLFVFHTHEASRRHYAPILEQAHSEIRDALILGNHGLHVELGHPGAIRRPLQIRLEAA